MYVLLCVCVFSILLEISMNNYSISYGRSLNGPVTFIVKTFLLTSKAGKKKKSRPDSQVSSAETRVGKWRRRRKKDLSLYKKDLRRCTSDCYKYIYTGHQTEA